MNPQPPLAMPEIFSFAANQFTIIQCNILLSKTGFSTILLLLSIIFGFKTIALPWKRLTFCNYELFFMNKGLTVIEKLSAAQDSGKTRAFTLYLAFVPSQVNLGEK